MTEYRVVFSYGYIVEAEDEQEAEELAFEMFDQEPIRPKDFGALVETTEDWWIK